MINLRFFPFYIIIAIFIGCTSSTFSDSSSPVETKEFSEVLTISEDNAYLFTKGSCYKNITLTLNVTTPKSIYFIFSNTGSSSTVSSSSYSVSSNDLTFSSSISSSILNSELNKNNFVEPKLPDVPDFVVGSSINKSVLASTTQSSVSNGDTYNFYEAVKGNIISATCRKIVSNISTNQGSKTLNIWVANNCWTDGGTKSKLITQTMVDAMADGFLKDGSNNDIYDWVTNICGAEWGTHNYSSALISSSQPINIFLCDVGNDNYTTGGTLGYFWSGNNFFKTYSSSVQNSNQMIMFCVDALIYANGGTTWSSTSEYPKIIFSTLAHEFQHMIFYYQQNVLKNLSHETWINEMMSMSIEDLVAFKLFGNYSSSPYYERFSGTTGLNDCNFYSLCKWNSDNSLPYYAMHYGFGSYLLRHYDGANFVKNIYSSGKINVDAVESVTGKNFSTLQRNWGAAYLLSNTSLSSGDFAYNIDVSSTLNGITYNLVNINAFTQGTPKIYSLNDKQNVNTRGNVYYKVADNLAVGTYKINIVMNSTDLELTVVAK